MTKNISFIEKEIRKLENLMKFEKDEQKRMNLFWEIEKLNQKLKQNDKS